MPSSSEQHEVLVWTDADRADIVQQVLGRMTELKVLAVGSPRSAERPVELARSFSAAAHDDLRQMIVELPAEYLFLATTSAVKGDDIAAALAQQTDVLSLEPLLDIGKLPAGSDGSAATSGGGGAGGAIHYLPQFRRCPAFLAATDPQQALGAIQAVQITSIGRPYVASLAARLIDALDMAMALCGSSTPPGNTPDTVTASWIGPTPDACESLRGLTGHLVVNLRFSDKATASIMVADRSPLHHRSATILGSAATLLLTDHDYRLVTTDDQSQPIILDQLAADDAPTDDASAGASLIVHHWRWLLTHRLTDADRAVDRRTLLAVAETALLAARTGQSESPRKLLQISGVSK